MRGLWTPTTPAAVAAGEAGRIRALQAKVGAQAAELCKLRAAVGAAEEALAAAQQQVRQAWLGLGLGLGLGLRLGLGLASRLGLGLASRLGVGLG